MRTWFLFHRLAACLLYMESGIRSLGIAGEFIHEAQCYIQLGMVRLRERLLEALITGLAQSSTRR
ncbi:MAG: hypothetical protein A2X46_02035 [Lentisphaerae bacterium GWF2_57_35]|nr:MAG: hypothetical protein A2X46_02035 [Lentisphaerae bacterium GWF2_57_35]